MLKPTKFLNLDSCVLNISSEILKIMLEQKIIPYTLLYEKLKEKYKDNIDYNFLPSLNFLFLLGKIDYSPNNDCLELII